MQFELQEVIMNGFIEGDGDGNYGIFDNDGNLTGYAIGDGYGNHAIYDKDNNMIGTSFGDNMGNSIVYDKDDNVQGYTIGDGQTIGLFDKEWNNTGVGYGDVDSGFGLFD